MAKNNFRTMTSIDCLLVPDSEVTSAVIYNRASYWQNQVARYRRANRPEQADRILQASKRMFLEARDMEAREATQAPALSVDVDASPAQANYEQLKAIAKKAYHTAMLAKPPQVDANGLSKADYAEIKAKAEAEALAEIKAEMKARAEAEALAEMKAKAEAEALAEIKAEALAEMKAKAEAEALAKAKAEAKAKARAEAEALAEAEAKKAKAKANGPRTMPKKKPILVPTNKRKASR